MHITAFQRTVAGGAEPPRSIAADIDPGGIQWPQFAEVTVCLLEVITEDRLEFLRPVVVGVELVGPAHELGVQLRSSALEQTVVDRLAHEVMMEAVQQVLLRRVDVADELLGRQLLQLRATLLRSASGASASTAGRWNSMPITAAGSAAARSNARGGRGGLRGAHGSSAGRAVVSSARSLTQRSPSRAQRAVVDQHRQHLLDVQRIALGRRRRCATERLPAGRPNPAGWPRSARRRHRRAAAGRRRCEPARWPQSAWLSSSSWRAVASNSTGASSMPSRARSRADPGMPALPSGCRPSSPRRAPRRRSAP